MRNFRFAAIGLLLVPLAALAEPTVEPEGPLAPCVTTPGSTQSDTDNVQSDSAWGVEIATAFSKQQALDDFARIKQDHADILGDYSPILVEVCNLSMGTDLQYSARIGMASREAADDLCAKLKAKGGACIVQKN